MTTRGATTARVVGWVGGLALMAVGVVGALVDADATHPWELARWVVGADLVHDLLLAPVVAVAGWGVGRLAPGWAAPPLRFAVGASAVFTLVAWPFVAGWGRDPRVPSLLNRNYAAGLGAYLLVIWVAALGWALLRRRCQRRAGVPVEDAAA